MSLKLSVPSHWNQEQGPERSPHASCTYSPASVSEATTRLTSRDKELTPLWGFLGLSHGHQTCTNSLN